MAMRVLRIYHSAVVEEYRERDLLLRTRYGHQLELVCPPQWTEGGNLVASTQGSEVPVNVVRIRGRRHPNLFWYSSRELRRIVRRLRPEIVDVHEEPYSLAAAGVLQVVAREAPDARVCIYSAQNLRKKYPPPFSWLERRALRLARASYPCSTEAAARLRARGFRGAVHVLPLGVTIPPERGARPGPLRVGLVARLEPYKGALIALSAFIAATRGSDCRMEIVGSGSEMTTLLRVAQGSGEMERITFAGALPQRETLDRIAGMDVLLVPSVSTSSWKEQFGRVAAQAMASGVAVIASDSGSLRELVDGCGILVPEGDVDALAAALRVLLDDAQQRRELAARGRQRAIERFSWESVAAGVDTMYREMR